MEKFCHDILKLLEEKRKSYNNSYTTTREEFGEVVFLIRLADKVNRLKALVQTGRTDFFSETYEDTIKDIVGYCLLELDFINRDA